jgi:iron complex outermembrane recepter protein
MRRARGEKPPLFSSRKAAVRPQGPRPVIEDLSMLPAKSFGGALALAVTIACASASAQQAEKTNPGNNTVALPTVEVTATGEGGGAPAGGGGSLTVPSVAEQREQIDQTVGSIGFVDANTPEIQTRHVLDLPDALKDVPGVFTDTRYGQEVRLSIRGSSLTRFFHLRGIELLQDGIPVNLADGSGDFDQVDPLYFRSIEVFKGGNALLFGESTRGGAINFVSPTAYRARFRYHPHRRRQF